MAGNPYTDAWYQSDQARQLVQTLAVLDQQAVAKLGPMVQTPAGLRRYSLLPGQVIRFNYAFHEPGHDPQPMVLIAKDDINDGLLHGINLHYLTFSKARSLLYYNCGSAGFNYRNISGDAYISDAYRTYRWNGIQGIKYEDCRFLNTLLSLQGLLTVQQLSAMIARIREMAAQQVAAPAVPTGPIPYQGVGTPTPAVIQPVAQAAPAIGEVQQTPVVGQ